MKYSRIPSKARGFLPNIDPVVQLNQSEYQELEQIAKQLPSLMKEGKFRKTIDTDLKPFEFDAQPNDDVLDRLMLIYSYFVSAYIHEDQSNKATLIPEVIAKPISKLANYLDRPPILAYDSYCLTNWKRINADKPVEVDNLALLQNFLGGIDEDWFILIHVDIEAKAGKIIEGILEARTCAYDHRTVKESYEALKTVADGIWSINKTMDRMVENCHPEVYYSRVRPYIFGFDNVIYQGVSDKPVSYRGETGAQSSVVPTLVAGLGIKHESSMLTQHLVDMRRYMPVQHRKFISNIEIDSDKTRDIRKFVIATKDKMLSDTYNYCIEGLIKFRTTHLKYAVEYIQKKVANPTGTGGTPYIAWLGKLCDETKEHLI